MRCLWGLLITVTSACLIKPQAVECDFGVCPAGTVCEPKSEKCVLPEQLVGCEGIDDGTPCTITAAADGVCNQEICVFLGCGDGVINGPEQCDGEAFPPGVDDCLDVNFYSPGVLGCNDNCTFDTSMCTETCGDLTLQPEYEICEIGIAPTQTCVDENMLAGVLQCRNCGPNTDTCVPDKWTMRNVASAAWEVQGHADDDVYAVLQNPFGLVHFDGTAWKKVDVTTCGVPSTEYIQQLWTPAPGVVFAAGGERVIHMVNGVCSTSSIPGHYISDLFATSATDIWAVVEDGVYHNTGSGWTRSMTVTGDDSPQAMWGSGPTDLWMIGGDATGALLWHYTGGASWPTPTRPSGIDGPNAIWGTAANDVYLGGGNNTSGAAISHYNGTTWTPIDPPVFSSSSSYVYRGWTAGGRVFISAADPGGPFEYPVLAYDGTGWLNLDAPTTTPQPLWASATSKVVLAAGTLSRIATFEGSARTDYSTTIADPGSIVVGGASDVYALDNGTGVSHWDGFQWTLDTATAGFSDLAAAPDGTMFGLTQADGLYRFDNGTWTVVEPHVDFLRNGSVVALAPNDVYIADEILGMFLHWTAPNTYQFLPDFAPNGEATISDLLVFGPGDIYVFGSTMDATVGFARHYNGTSWSDVTLPAGTKSVRSAWARSANDIFAVREGMEASDLIHYDGTSWTVVAGPWNANGMTGVYVSSVWGTATELFVATSAGLQYFDGTQWSPVSLGVVTTASRVVGSATMVGVLTTGTQWSQIARLRPWPKP